MAGERRHVSWRHVPAAAFEIGVAMPHFIFKDLSAEEILSLAPEELAGIVLDFLCRQETNSGYLHRGNFTLTGVVAGFPERYQEPIQQAMIEAWVWLEREGLIAPKPGATGEWVFVTRRGRRAQNAEGVAAYRHASMLPKQLLHPALVQKVWPLFIRGEYDTAVFQAFKEVEVVVRNTAGLTLADLGVNLMRRAFNSDTGALTDMSLPEGERKATADFFAGAIGRYKNPQSHRHVALTDPVEAVETLLLASHLLRIVESQRES